MTEQPTTAAGDDDEFLVEPPSPKIWEGLPATRAEARQQDTSALREALQDLVWAVGDYAENTSALGPRRSIERARALLVALAALPPSAPPALDVERLTKALEASNYRDMRYTNVERQAERIVTEYARLEQDP